MPRVCSNSVLPPGIVHKTRAKLVSNWEQNMFYTKRQQILCRYKISMLTGFKVLSLASKCTFYRTEHKANGGHQK